MWAWLREQKANWQERRQRKSDRFVNDLKIRYHIFRALLDNNNRAVTLITQLATRLRTDATRTAHFESDIRAVLEESGQMVEKMIRLGGERYKRLSVIHANLAARIHAALETLPKATASPLCLPLLEVGQDMAGSVGGKAARLAKLKRMHPALVPDGFVIPVQACRLFLEQDGLALRLSQRLQPYLRTPSSSIPQEVVATTDHDILDAPLPANLAKALDLASRPFLKSKTGKGLAVRSSAISEDGPGHSFAGQYATVLNVTNAGDLASAFKKVVASSYNRRSMAYRIHAGLDPLCFDMAVLCLQMVPARAAGIFLTRHPNEPGEDRMLVSAVAGLGEAAVAGSSMADIYLPWRDKNAGTEVEAVIAKKEQRLVCCPGGGMRLEPVPTDEQMLPALTKTHLESLVGWGLEIEVMEGGPQDIEWALDEQGRLIIVQTRPLKIDRWPVKGWAQQPQRQELVLGQGRVTSGGTATGRVCIAKGRQDLEGLADGPCILVLHQSMVDAVHVLASVKAVLVDLGNPADHLSCVAREYGIPMLTGLNDATRALMPGQWVTVDATIGEVVRATPEDIDRAVRNHRALSAMASRPASQMPPGVEALFGLIARLNLTDAYGPTFSMVECRSLHDMVRFMHEKAVLAMFEANDEMLEETSGAVLQVEAQIPFLLNIIDLGGGIAPQRPQGRKVAPHDIISMPFTALWQGLADPDVHWGPPPGSATLRPALSNWMTDAAAERPIGMPNYMIVSRDYLNLNARMDFHFTMVDTVCGPNNLANYIKFRFKGGGNSPQKRQRRAHCIAEVLAAHDFFIDEREDLVSGALLGASQTTVQEKLAVLGRLLGFTRLLDAAMTNDDMPHFMARAFLEGDYGLTRLTAAHA